MKFEKYTTLKGALQSVKFREVPDTDIPKRKASKVMNKKALKVTIHDIEFDADTDSINYMSSVLSIFHAHYNKGISTKDDNGDYPDKNDVYEEVYIDTTLNWKDANNKWKVINGEILSEALQATMVAVGNLL